MATTEKKIVQDLEFLLDQAADARKDEDWPEELLNCRTADFEDEMVLSANAGLTLRLKDGSRFQITVVRSK